MRLREELDREREERNYFQLERDKVNTFWEITKRQLEERKAELRNKDREMEEAEEHHQVEIKVYKQKVKHLLYEHQNNIAELKAESKQHLKDLHEKYLQTIISQISPKNPEQDPVDVLKEPSRILDRLILFLSRILQDCTRSYRILSRISTRTIN